MTVFYIEHSFLSPKLPHFDFLVFFCANVLRLSKYMLFHKIYTFDVALRHSLKLGYQYYTGNNTKLVNWEIKT